MLFRERIVPYVFSEDKSVANKYEILLILHSFTICFKPIELKWNRSSIVHGYGYMIDILVEMLHGVGAFLHKPNSIKTPTINHIKCHIITQLVSIWYLRRNMHVELKYISASLYSEILS